MTGVLVCIGLILALLLFTSFWWWIMLVPFLFGLLLSKSGRHGFRIGAVSAGLSWLGMSVYLYLTSSKIIASRVAEMFGMNFSWALVIITALVAVVAAGIAGSAGHAIKTAFFPKK